MRRLRKLVFALALVVPTAAGAATPAQDPDGLVAAATPWLDVFIRAVLSQLGI